MVLVPPAEANEGSGVSGAIFFTPAPGILKTMISLTTPASMIAWRRLPGPESLVLVTVKVAAGKAAAARMEASKAAGARRRTGKVCAKA